MPYIINNSRGEVIAVIPDGITNTSATSLSLLGKNVTPYGEIEIENLVKHLENFANNTEPSNPIEGQLWWDISSGAIRVYTGLQWKKVSGMTVSAIAPTVEPKEGELWFDSSSKILKVYGETDRGFEWITNNRVIFLASAPDPGLEGDFYYNTNSNQLFISDGTSWSLIGPPAAADYPGTLWESTTVRDLNGDPEPVIKGTVNEEVIAILSRRSFTILPVDRPAGFTDLAKGLTINSSSKFSGIATSAEKLFPGRNINGILFDGSTDVEIGLSNALTPGNYIDGLSFDGTVANTWKVDASSSSLANKVVARDADRNFSANLVTANLSGTVFGTANNVRDIVSSVNGGTGQSTYANGEILIGNSGSLSKGTITGTGAIVVTNSAGAIQISYTGGSGTGSVTSVGIDAGAGISVSGSPITSSGSITVSNAGVTRILAGSGVSVDRNTGDVTVSASGGGGGDMLLAADQTVTGRKSFTGTDNIVAGAYRFTYPDNNGIWFATAPYRYAAVAVNNSLFTHRFYTSRLVVDGNADPRPDELDAIGVGGAITGADNGVSGGSGLVGVHTSAAPGLGVGVSAIATNPSYTGVAFQTGVRREKSGLFGHIRCFSNINYLDNFNVTSEPVFYVDGGGNVSFDGTASTPAADYAEYFEWADGNPDNEDRVGYTVALIGNKIKTAELGDTVIGVVSVMPGVVGDAAEEYWSGKYLKDEWGRSIRENYKVYSWKEKADDDSPEVSRFKECNTSEIPDAGVPDNAELLMQDLSGNQFTRVSLNPDYDPSQTYVPRSQRKEWSPIGLVGKLKVRKGQITDSRWIKLRDINDGIEEWLVR
jgi:hypothetical protein